MAQREYHSTSVEPIDGGHLVRETHMVNGQHSEVTRFEAGRRPSRDTAALVKQGPAEGKDAAGSSGFAGARRYLEDHI